MENTNAPTNRILKVEISLLENGLHSISVTKEFAPQYGGGTQTIYGVASKEIEHALEVATHMACFTPP